MSGAPQQLFFFISSSFYSGLTPLPDSSLGRRFEPVTLVRLFLNSDS